MSGQGRTAHAGPDTLVVLAAGLGSRFGGAKQVEAFGPDGRMLLELNAYGAWTAGVRRLCVVTREALIPLLEPRLAGLRHRMTVEFQVQSADLLPDIGPRRTRPWGTAHAVLAVPDPGAAFVANADDLYAPEAFGSVARALRAMESAPTTRRPVAVAAGYPVDATLSPHGGVSRAWIQTTRAETRSPSHAPPPSEPDAPHVEPVEGLGELREVARTSEGIQGLGSRGPVQVPEDARVSMNLWGLTDGWWPEFQSRLGTFAAEVLPDDAEAEFLLPDAILQTRDAGRAHVVTTPVGGTWCGLTHPQDAPHVERTVSRLHAEGHYPPSWFQDTGGPESLTT